jgi:hypothetical protein
LVNYSSTICVNLPPSWVPSRGKFRLGMIRPSEETPW